MLFEKTIDDMMVGLLLLPIYDEFEYVSLKTRGVPRNCQWGEGGGKNNDGENKLSL